MLKKFTGKETVGTVVPNHKSVKPGTLKSSLKLARIKEEDFAKYL